MGHIRRRLALSENDNDIMNYFLGKPLKNEFSEFTSCTPENWEQFRDQVLHIWVHENPGTRPKAWWKYDAPTASRKLIKGTGKKYSALHNDMNLRNNLGIPEACWYQEIDLDNPPVYESQAEYLKHLDLLMLDEQDRFIEKDFEYKIINTAETII